MELGATRAAVYGRGTDGHVRLYLVDLDHPRVEISWLTGLGGPHTLASIQFDKVPVSPLGDAAAAPWLLNAIAIVLGGVGVGGARRCLELGVRYSHERYAFGSPIGSFQAIRHKLADMYTGVELADSCVRTGFSVLESDGDDLALAAAVSRVSALDAYRFATEEAIEVHGAVGYTWDSDLHLYLRNARLIEGVLGPVEWWRGQVLDCYEAGET
jgi:acyl-CoA dehydrogenase